MDKVLFRSTNGQSPVVDLRAVLGTLRPGQVIDLDTSCRDVFADAWHELERHFRLAPVDNSPPGRFQQFRLGEPAETNPQ